MFRGIDLTDSFVLSWRVTESRLVFDLEASIWPNSPHYEPPRPNEHTCYKRAVLAFEGFEKVEGLKKMHEVMPTADADGSQDFGCIDTLEATENGYHVSGEFGSVTISGGDVRFEVLRAA